MKCQRLHAEAKAPRVAATCDAFPEGIPRAIFWDGERHFDPHPGDNELQFLPRPGFEDMEVKWRDPVRLERKRQEIERLKELRGWDDDTVRLVLGESAYRQLFGSSPP